MAGLTPRTRVAQSSGLAPLPTQPIPPYSPDMTPPPVITGASLTPGPMRSRLGMPQATRKVWAAVVSRVEMRQGETHLYVHGAERVAVPNYGGHSAGSGATPPSSSSYQPVLVGSIVNVARNGFLRRAGVPLGIGYPGRAAPYDSIRTQQITTNVVTGGAGPGQSRPKPQFGAVQTVPRYRTQPRRYGTTSGKG